MKSYINQIEHEIELQIQKSDKIALIRVEGFDNPYIYKEICKYLNNNKKIEFYAKLSKEKYGEFVNTNKEEYKKALSYLESNNFIDLEGAMTRWRNNSAEIELIEVEKKGIVLLLGTEAVQDKGGLADFYKITPETILDIVKKDYSLWFKELLQEKGIEESNLKAINTFFKALFNNVNVNLVVLSNLIDYLDTISLITIDDILQEICFRLQEDWGIPSIKDAKEVPKGKNLVKGSLKSAEIIEKSFKFITRVQFKKGITKRDYDKYVGKIDKFACDKELDIHEPFPIEIPIFKSYVEFKSQLLDFIQGKDYLRLKDKFLKVDFSLINRILNLKLETTGKTQKDKLIKLFGEPLEVIISMISQGCLEYKGAYKDLPDFISLRVNGVSLSNCSTDEEKEELFQRLCNNLGGLVDFLQLPEDLLTKNISIQYENNKDPFVYDKEELIPITKTANMNELCKISFTVRCFEDEEKCRRREYLYCFSPKDSWVQDFMLIDNTFLLDINHKAIKVPLYTECSNLTDYLNCESDEEFFMKLPKLKTKVIDGEFQSLLNCEFSNPSIQNELGKFIFEYKQFLSDINCAGFYSTLIKENSSKKVFLRFSSLMKTIRDNYTQLTSTQRESLYLILNIFLIGNKSFRDFKLNKCFSFIMPPYHPIMIEKLYYKMIYLKNSFQELLSLINVSAVSKENILEKRLSYYFRMCSITSGFDAHSFNINKIVTASKVHGRYALYSLENYDFSIVSDKAFDSEFIEDEEVDKKQLIRKTHKSNIISKNIVDYLETFPAKVDGINILFVNPDDMQHIVAGIHDAVEQLSDKINKINLNIRILVPPTRKSGGNYLKFWLDNCFEDEINTNIKTSLNYIDFESIKLEHQLSRFVEDQDLTYIYKVLNEIEIEFTKVSNEVLYSECKYPAVYTPMPISVSQETRGIDISQRQFSASNEHLQLTHKFMRPNEIESAYRVVKKLHIVDKKKALVEYIHEKSKWVVCLDETIDKNLLNSENTKVIGFSTGQGIFGELNTTVSARQDILSDIQLKLKNRLMSKFNKWLPEIAEKAANNCIDISKNLDGSKMLKALNPRDYEIHNYLAYVLTMQSIKMNSENNRYVIRTLINLDNYMHWFDNNLSSEYISDSKLRPDFLVLEIENSEELFNKSQPLKVKATVIECKMVKESQAHIDEAKCQLETGLKVLASNFSPNNKSVNRRYWFNQLYRALIFSKINLRDNKIGYEILLDKLADIYEGKFDIEWNGRVYAYWTDRNDSHFDCNPIAEREEVEFNLNKLEIFTAGQLFIQKLLLPKDFRNVELEFNVEEEEDDKSQFSIEVLEADFDELDNEDIGEKLTTEKVSSDQETIVSKTEETIDHYVEKNEPAKTIDTTTAIPKDEKKTHIRFLLGEDIRTKERFYWEYTHKNLNNRHLLINGNSGSGKTYCIQALILEAVKNNISVIVFDYTDGFTKSKLSPILLEKLGGKFEERFVKYDRLPLNPFRKGPVLVNGQEREELDIDVATRIAASFGKVYDLGEQQVSAVYGAVREGLKEHGDTMTLQILADKLSENPNKPAQTTLSKIIPLVDYEPFIGNTDFTWKDIIDEKGKMYVIQLSGYDRMIQLILTDLILWDIWNYAVKNGNEDTPIPLVLDEAQNLSHDENTPSGKILAEGRKFGLSGWYATQFMKGRLNAAEIGNLQQSAQKLYFSPPEESIKEVASYIDITYEGSKMWAEKLSKLTKGHCVISGYKSKDDKFDKYEPRIIKITSLEERVNE